MDEGGWYIHVHTTYIITCMMNNRVYGYVGYIYDTVESLKSGHHWGRLKRVVSLIQRLLSTQM